MSFTIAVAGKGGTGKTTLCALLMAELLERKKGPILAVDADPNANLGQVLGIEIPETVGRIREKALGSINKVPTGMTKEGFLSYSIQSALIEALGFDIISMGRPEGLGCYCYANNLIRNIMDELSDNYAYMLIDNEAGMEHLSRRTTRDVDLLILVADASKRGVETVAKIADLAAELKIKIGRKGVVIGRLPENINDCSRLLDPKWGLELFGAIPQNSELADFDIEGKPLVSLSPDCRARLAVREMVDKLGL